MSTENTPGPWRVVGSGSPIHGLYIRADHDAGIYIARVSTQRASREEDKANAALIARAPEMTTEIERLREERDALLEALKELVAESEPTDAPRAAPRHNPNTAGFMMARDAIAKVEEGTE